MTRLPPWLLSRSPAGPSTTCAFSRSSTPASASMALKVRSPSQLSGCQTGSETP